MDKVKQIILISGKRKSGKDYISNTLQSILHERSQIIRISAPIKTEWATRLNLDLKELLSDGPYKEEYRKDMIDWSDSVRAQDYGYFCRAAMLDAKAEIIIVSDIRRKTDIKYFRETYGSRVFTIRINAKEAVREARGWSFAEGVDNVTSECGLDDYTHWDLSLNNNSMSDGEACVKAILSKFEV